MFTKEVTSEDKTPIFSNGSCNPVEVVISGISGSFPNSKNVYEFRDNLYNKIDMVSNDVSRWASKHPEIPRRSGILPEVEKFDAGFFGMHYRQAYASDPTLRGFLEKAIEAILDAGINPSELEGTNTAVLMASSLTDSDLDWFYLKLWPKYHSILGVERSLLANRLSYFLKLNGPSFVVDTACSSTLTAVEHAYTAIREGRYDNVIIGGLNLCLNPTITLEFVRLGLLSADGTCKVFDESASGYVRSETLGVILLQKSTIARRVYARVVHAKSNCDGFKEEGITFPSTESQTLLLKEVYEESKVDLLDVGYMEAHGTGTPVGDPEEIRTIESVFLNERRSEPLLVGSVKSNIGHSEAASSLASITKVVIAMENDIIPPNIHFRAPGKNMPALLNGKLKVVTEPTAFPKNRSLIGVNSFGFGGANCHVILQKNPQLKINRGCPNDHLPRLVCVSGRTENSISAILDDINSRPLDAEYIKLYHQIFSLKINGHMYRGYAIVSKSGEIKRSKKFSLGIQKSLHLNFADFGDNWLMVARDLMGLQIFTNCLKRIDDILAKKNVNITKMVLNENRKGQNSSSSEKILTTAVIQLGILEIIKNLGIAPSSFSCNGLSEFICDYYQGLLDLEEVVLFIYDGAFSKLSIVDTETEKEGMPLRNFPTLNHNDSVVLDIGFKDSTQTNNVKHLSFHHSNETSAVVQLLEILGSLYESGYNFDPAKLYPEVLYPVSRGTPMISPLIKWQHKSDWYVTCYSELAGLYEGMRTFEIRLDEEEFGFISGHVIDGRTLFPATGYLYLVWNTLVSATQLFDQKIVFENCKFLRSFNVSNEGKNELVVRILKGSQNFEITDGDTILVTGSIHLNQAPTQEDAGALKSSCEEKLLLYSKDIYKELRLRGYNYKGAFKSLKQFDSIASRGLITWEENWVSFMDNMLQMKILEKSTRFLYVPTEIRSLSIDFKKHLSYSKLLSESKEMTAFSNKETNTLSCGGIEIIGLQATAICRRKPGAEAVLEKYEFVPNCLLHVRIHQSIRIHMQLILENTLSTKITVVEVFDKTISEQPLAPLIQEALEDLPLIKPDITIFSKQILNITNKEIKVQDKKLMMEVDCDLVIGSKLLGRPAALKEALAAIKSNGHILSRESADFDENCSLPITIVTIHTLEKEKLLLVKKAVQLKVPIIVDVSNVTEDFPWLSKLQEGVKTGQDVLVIAQNQPLNGTLGLVNCVRREPGGNKIKCLFTFGESPNFDPNSSFYRDQLTKNLAINVFKEAQWGTYRHLLLEEIREIESEHCFVDTTTRGDLSSLKWLEGSLTRNSVATPGKDLISVYYSSLNFKDIMIASGKLNLDGISNKRSSQQSSLGIEFSGRNSRGERVAGMIFAGAISTLVAADNNLMFPVPEDWSLEDAATVPVVYLTVLYAFVIVGKIKRGSSILIHAGSGGIGQAAINIASHFGCEIYTTVGTKEKREFLLKQFPQLKSANIGNSRDTSFEHMIFRRTTGRGVDVVLNSLAEEKLQASVRCLSVGGKFLEIGKFDLANNNSLSLSLLEKEASFNGVMLDGFLFTDSTDSRYLFSLLKDYIEKGVVKSIVRTVFENGQVEEAFRFMATGKHIGKVLIRIKNEEKEKLYVPPVTLHKGVPRYWCDPTKVYVVAGGLGGFGLELADWLFLRGARKLILTSRTGVKTGYQAYRIKIWRDSGASIIVSSANITEVKGCKNLLLEANALGAVDAIFNLAVVLKDALLENQTADDFKQVFLPKATATQYLDQISRKLCHKLRNFVVFSSVSCGRGNAGQANYGMANSIMERICEERKTAGFPASAIEWGAVGDVGLVAEMQEEYLEMEIGGTLQQSIVDCLKVMDCLLKQNNSIVSSMVVAEKRKGSGSTDDIVGAVAAIIGIKDIKTISLHSTFPEIGMDSMGAVEIKQTLERDFDVFLTTQKLRSMTFSTLQELQNEKLEEKGLKKNKTTEEIDFKQLFTSISDEESLRCPIVNFGYKAENKEKISIVFLPGVEGSAKVLQPLACNLLVAVSCLQYPYNSCNESVVKTAKFLLPAVKSIILKELPFQIVAHSYGTVVALELLSLLENEGYTTGQLICLDGSPHMLKTLCHAIFDLKSEEYFETSLLCHMLAMFLGPEIIAENREQIFKCKNFEERLDIASKIIPSNASYSKYYLTELTLTILKRTKSVLDYQPSFTKIKSVVKLYKASGTTASGVKADGGLSEFCENAVEVKVFEGDHITFLKDIKMAQSILNSREFCDN